MIKLLKPVLFAALISLWLVMNSSTAAATPLSVPYISAFCAVSQIPPGLYHERPPYFSYFRPVYYRLSYPDVCHVAKRRAQKAPSPVRIKNPYVASSIDEELGYPVVTVTPLRIINPYVKSDSDTDQK